MGTNTPLQTATFTPEPRVTFTPEPTATLTPRPTSTATPIPWQSYKFTYSINIGGIGKLWMAIPQEWDGVGIRDLTIVDLTPKPDDIYQDNQGNKIAFWNAGKYGTRNYSITFTVKLATIRYAVNLESIGEYDETSVEYQRYTQPSARIESDNENIVQLAKQIVGNETNPYLQAKLIHRWVSNNIKGGGKDGETALSSLNDQNASCGGHSFLFVALLRSLGIPARDVSGLHTVYQGSLSNGSFWEHTLYSHVWSEFYIPNYGWIQSDTSGGDQNFAAINEPRIIFAHGEDIEPGHDFPLQTIPWFHIPHTNIFTGSDPKTQNPGDELSLTVERLP